MKSDPSRVYVGNLSAEVTRDQLFDLFSSIGRLRGVDLKQQAGMHFAFVEFEDERDALASIKQRNGMNFKGCMLRVEMPRAAAAAAGKSRTGGKVYRVNISGLPSDANWQDLKEQMRMAGSITFADVFPDGTGVIEFTHERDVARVLEKFNGQIFTGRSGTKGTMKLVPEGKLAREPAISADPWNGFPSVRHGYLV